MFINPWIYYIVNDEMPEFDPSDGDMFVFLAFLLISMVWAFGTYFVLKQIPICSIYKYLFYAADIIVYIALTIWLLPKALDKWG